MSIEQIGNKRYNFGDNLVSTIQNRTVRLLGSYVLDSAEQPKQITIHSYDLHRGRVDLLGIYKIDGDRLNGDKLTIALRKNGPRPERFESKPDSDVHLLVLAKLPKPQVVFSPRGEEKPSQAILDLPVPLPSVDIPPPPEPKGSVLLYEVDPSSVPVGMTSADPDKLFSAIDRRLNSGVKPLARVRKLDDGRIEVALLRRGDVDREHVERLLARSGTLEFHVLANSSRDKAIIERAQKDPSQTGVLDAAGKRLACGHPSKKDRRRVSPTTRGSLGGQGNKTIAK